MLIKCTEPELFCTGVIKKSLIIGYQKLICGTFCYVRLGNCYKNFVNADKARACTSLRSHNLHESLITM